METKFTKGPWKVFQGRIPDGEEVCKLTETCKVITDSPLDNDPLPDAHLIAGAPEMYNELQELLYSSHFQTEFPFSAERIESLLEKIRGD